MEEKRSAPKFSSFKLAKREVEVDSREIVKSDSKREKEKKEKKVKKSKKDKSFSYYQDRDKERGYSNAERHSSKVVKRRKEFIRSPSPVQFTFPSELTLKFGVYLDTEPELNPSYAFKKVPRYKRFGGGKVLGLKEDLRIVNSKTVQLDRDGIPLVCIEPYLAKNDKLKESRYTTATKTSVQVQLSGQKLDELRQKYFLQTQPNSGKICFLQPEPTEPSASNPLDPNLETNNLIELQINQKTKFYETQLKLNPNDTSLWIEYVDYQKVSTQLRSTYSGKTSLVVQTQIQLSLLDRAFQHNPNDVQLFAKYFELGTLIWDVSTLTNRWEQVLLEHPSCLLLWLNYLDLFLNELSLFKFDLVLDKFRWVLDSLLTYSLKVKDSSVVEAGLLKVFAKLVCFVRESGYLEWSIGLFQAMVELNFFQPTGISSVALPYQLEALAKFWVKGFPKFGESGATGWATYHRMTTYPNLGVLKPTDAIPQPYYDGVGIEWIEAEFQGSTLPTSIYVNEGRLLSKDPYKAVFFDELEPFLFNLSSTHSKQMFLDLLVRFFICTTFNWSTSDLPLDPSFEAQVLDGLTHKLHQPNTDGGDQSMEAGFIGLDKVHTETEFFERVEGLWLGDPKDHRVEFGMYPYQPTELIEKAIHPHRLHLVQLNPNLNDTEYLQFVSNGLNQLNTRLQQVKLNGQVALGVDSTALLRLQFALHAFEVDLELRVRNFKKLLKKYPNCIPLYMDYATYLFLNGEIDQGRKVFQLSFSNLPNLEPDPIQSGLVLSWIGLEFQLLLQDKMSLFDQVVYGYATNQMPQLGQFYEDVDVNQLGKALVEKLKTVPQTDLDSYFHFQQVYVLWVYRRDGLVPTVHHLIYLIPKLHRLNRTLTEEVLTQALPQLILPHLQPGRFGYPPKLVRQLLTLALSFYSTNTKFLSLFYQLERKLKLDNRFHAYLNHLLLDKAKASSLLYAFAIRFTTNRNRKVSLFHRFLHEASPLRSPTVVAQHLYHTKRQGSWDALKGLSLELVRRYPSSKGIFMLATKWLKEEVEIQQDLIQVVLEKGLRVKYQF